MRRLEGWAGLTPGLTLQYDEPNAITRELCRKRVTVVDYPDGRLAIRYRGLDLPYTIFDKLRQVSASHHRREQAPRRRPLAHSRAAARTRRGSQPEGAAPLRADRPHVHGLAEPDPSRRIARRQRTGSTTMSVGSILCDGQDAVKPGPEGLCLRRRRA